ncbi:MAG: acyl-CoA/acyl-ACP dehydrogenase [Microlunatus sp.]|nr:acyl-CoA/acyl-ACP dehydrogenase [Microlunatus sp.]
MQAERAVLDHLMPGLDDKLAGYPRTELESTNSPGLDLFRAADGPGLLVPQMSGGLGATAREAVAVQYAVGGRSGSLAVGTTMHHFSMASLIALGRASASGLETVLVEAVATQRHLLASGFAEGRPGSGILSPTMAARPVPGGLLVSGAKKPCSLARSMTMLTASVAVRTDDGGPGQLAVVLVPADTDGVRVEDFWVSPVLAGAESDAIVLEDVLVPEALVVHTDMVPGGGLDATHRIGFIWFELLMTASYAGIAGGLVEEALANPRSADSDVVTAWAQVRTTLSGLGAVGDALDAGRFDDALLGEVLLVRYQLQDALPRLTATCAEALGGMAFIGSGDLAHRLASLSCLAFHPPARHRTAAALRGLHDGRPLTFD